MEVNEVPKFLMTNPTTSSHSIMIADPTDDVNPYTIPLQLEGVVSYFEYSLPTSAEYKNEEIPHLESTAMSLAWDPYDKDFASLEESLLDFRGQLTSAAQSDGVAGMGTGADVACDEKPHWKLCPVSMQYDAADVTDDDNFGVALEANCQMQLVCTHHTPETYDVCGVHSGKRQGAVDYITLANCWQIPLHKARDMVKQTIQ
jgi:hypothetical protein